MNRKRLLTVRFSQEDYARIVEKARLSGRPLSVLVRDALGHVKTWTAQDRAAFQERTLTLARIGSALGDMAHTLRQNPGCAPILLPKIEELQGIFEGLEEP
jgi:hypothetical protein